MMAAANGISDPTIGGRPIGHLIVVWLTRLAKRPTKGTTGA
jgi:hypothetical protein